MEDFVLLSIHDLQLPSSMRVNKRDVMAYVFLDNKCLDSLVLGSSAAAATNKKSKTQNTQQSSQASQLDIIPQSQQRAQKVRISLFDTKKKLQIILKKIGAEDKNRFGSITFSLKKLVQGVGNSYLHWVTLFDSLEDDIFDGQLGEDDYEQPRILIEYSVIGGQYTSVMNNMDKLKSDLDNKQINQHKQKLHQAKQAMYEDQEAGGGAVDSQESEEESGEHTIVVRNKRQHKQQQQQKQFQQNISLQNNDNNKGQINNNRDFTLTVEYIETRQDKLKGRSEFKGTIIDASSGLMNNFVQQDLDKIKRLEREKDQEITKLVALCEKFDINRVKKKISESVAKTIDDLEMQDIEIKDKEGVILSFIDKLIEDHKKQIGVEAQYNSKVKQSKIKVKFREYNQQSISKKLALSYWLEKSVIILSSDVYSLSLEKYKTHLQDLEQRDISTLKKQMHEMKRIKQDLSRDLDQEYFVFQCTQEASLMQQKEDLWDQVDPRIIELRKQCLLLIQELEEIKADYIDGGQKSQAQRNDPDTADEEEESIDQEESEEQGSLPNQSQSTINQNKNKAGFLTYMTREEKKAIAQEMFYGNDKLFKLHMDTTNELFLQSKTLQKDREIMLIAIINILSYFY